MRGGEVETEIFRMVFFLEAIVSHLGFCFQVWVFLSLRSLLDVCSFVSSLSIFVSFACLSY
jgi:hypothetical protein